MSDDAASTATPAALRALPHDAREFQGQHAGIVTRSTAGAVDALTIVVILFASWAGWSAVRFLSRPARFTFPNPSHLVDAVVLCCVAFLYFTAAWATSGRTVGGQLLGLRVVNRRGDRVRWGVSALRSALCVLFPVGLLWTVVSRQNRSAQDILLGTFVIYDWRVLAPRTSTRPDAGPRGGNAESPAADDPPL
jgi:uncharacterized RDD family membrane protein YckC